MTKKLLYLSFFLVPFLCFTQTEKFIQASVGFGTSFYEDDVDIHANGFFLHDIVYHEAYNINVPEYKETIVMLKKATNNYIKDQQLTHELSLLENYNLYGGLGLSDLNNDSSPDLVVIRDGFVQVFLNKEGKEIDGEEPVEAQQKPLKIYPNPTRDFLNIDSGNSENKIKQLELYNILGQLIFSISNSTPKQIHKVDFSALSSGSYMLSINLEKGERLHRKVVRY